MIFLAIAAPDARAQTLAATSFMYPERFDKNGNDLNTTGSRPQNFTPLGISYQDCIDDQRLQFSVAVSGFTGSTDIQVWATKTGMCSNDSDRGVGQVPTCWFLTSLASVNQVSVATRQFTIRVQDIIGPQNAIPPTGSYTPATAAACTTQSTFSSQSFSVWFVPIQNSSHAVGTPYSYTLPVDLVGPPAPTSVSDAVGDTLFTLNWSPNSDTDTNGYDVFMSPIKGQEGVVDMDGAADGAVATPEPRLVCPDTGAPVAPDDASTDATSDGAADATTDAASGSTDAAMSGATDAGCNYVNVGGPMAATCGNPILQSSVVQDGGAGQVTDGGGEGGTVVESGNGGVSTIPYKYLVGSNNGNPTVSDKSTGTYTVTGLVNNVTYTAVVAAVDGFGNIGPPSPEKCDYPAPVNDFWHNYKSDGGGAGGFCALEEVGAPGQSLAGVALAVSLAAMARRRRRSAS